MSNRANKSAVEAQFAGLPDAFRESEVGKKLALLIAQLDASGRAPLAKALASLYPAITPEKARLKLQTQVMNRLYTTNEGITPLQLKMSRKMRSAASREEDQSLWFECEAPMDYANLTPSNPRYEEYEFVGGQALQATAEELRQAQNTPSPVRAHSEADKAKVPQLGAFTESEQALVLSDASKLKLNQGRDHALHGLGIRAQITDEKFVPAEAQQTIAMPTEHGPAVGRSVTCINAMLDWACTPVDVSTAKPSRFKEGETEKPYTKPLLAMLGDYGTGKTSHAQQLNRILNGMSTSTDKPAGSPTAVMVDLALLAGADRLSELNLTELLVLALKKQREQGFTNDEARVLIQRVKLGEVLLIYDGFDELIKTTRDKLHSVLQQLLLVLQPTISSTTREPIPSQAKVMLSCRTHYFRDAHEQLAFFDTRARGNAKRGDYLCLTLMPWSIDNIKTYLGKHLNGEDTKKLLTIIQDTYNLKELASRPVLLAMMSEQLGQLLRQQKTDEPIDAAKLYSISVAEWVQRDTGKHVIHATHKPLVMGALASAMTKEGTETWAAEKLDRWIVTVLPVLYPNVYELPQKSKEIQDDLRTATFIVRPVKNQFNFAHKSFKEYFTARFIWDCLTLIDQGAIGLETARSLLVSQSPNTLMNQWAMDQWLIGFGLDILRSGSLSQSLNTETMAFLKEWWQAQTRHNPEQAVRNTAVLIALLQNPEVSFVPFYVDENGGQVNRSKVKESEQNGHYQAPELHQVLFEIGLSLGLFDKASIEQVRVFVSPRGRGFQSTVGLKAPIYAVLDTHINLRGLEFNCNRWRGLDFSDLPLDLRDANVLQLRTYHCDFGNTLCACANWTHTVMRDSTIKDMDWGEGAYAADRRGQMIRYGETKQPTKPLKGPWTSKPEGLSKEFGNATFDTQGNLLSFDEEAADSWLFRLASGRAEPVEFGVPVED